MNSGNKQYLTAAEYDHLEILLFKGIEHSVEARNFVFELQTDLDPGVDKVGFKADFTTGIVKVYIDPTGADMTTKTATHFFHQLPVLVNKAHLAYLKSKKK